MAPAEADALIARLPPGTKYLGPKEVPELIPFQPAQCECCECKTLTSTRFRRCQKRECLHERCEWCPLFDRDGGETVPRTCVATWFCLECGRANEMADLVSGAINTSACRDHRVAGLYNWYGERIAAWPREDVAPISDPGVLRWIAGWLEATGSHDWFERAFEKMVNLEEPGPERGTTFIVVVDGPPGSTSPAQKARLAAAAAKASNAKKGSGKN